MPTFHFLVGTFNSPHIYTLAFNLSPESKPNLHVIHRSNAVGSHSWLHLADDKKKLYATAWTDPPSLVAYDIRAPNEIRQISRVTIASRSGYVCASEKAVYSAGGASGEVFGIDPETGGFAGSDSESRSSEDYDPLQVLSFVEDLPQQDDGGVMDFGGLRHGAHSADLSPDGKSLYIADIGRNCIWTYSIDAKDGRLKLGEKHISPRPTDGPRHCWPHPSGKYLYVLQEHTSMVDVFEVSDGGVKLKHVQGVKVLPDGEKVEDYWADEVRTSFSKGGTPKYLYASNRGLKEGTKGYVAAYKLAEDGRIEDGGDSENKEAGLLHMWQTPTSGGWANAIQPGPTVDGVEYIALTDSEQGFVFVLSWNGSEFKEAARVKLDEGAGAATAVWL